MYIMRRGAGPFPTCGSLGILSGELREMGQLGMHLLAVNLDLAGVASHWPLQRLRLGTRRSLYLADVALILWPS